MSEDERTNLMEADETAAAPTRRVYAGGRRPADRQAHMPPDHPDYDDESRGAPGKKVGIWSRCSWCSACSGSSATRCSAARGPAHGDRARRAGPDAEQARAADHRRRSCSSDLSRSRPTSTRSGRSTRTDPGGGNAVAENSRVTLFVGTGPAQATVPALTGQDRSRRPQGLLQGAGLRLGGQTERETTDSQPGRQDPLVGPRPGVSRGRQHRGRRRRRQGADDRRGAGRVRAVRRPGSADAARTPASPTSPPARWTAAARPARSPGTNPSAGTQVSKDATITLQISRGNQQSIPNVVGQDYRSAVAQLSAAGLSYRLQAQQVSRQLAGQQGAPAVAVRRVAGRRQHGGRARPSARTAAATGTTAGTAAARARRSRLPVQQRLTPVTRETPARARWHDGRCAYSSSTTTTASSTTSSSTWPSSAPTRSCGATTRSSPPTVDEFDAVLISPGPGTPERAGRSIDLVHAAASSGRAAARRVPRPPGARRGLGRGRRTRSRAAARQDVAGPPRGRRGAARAARPVRRHPLPLADHPAGHAARRSWR